MSRDVGAPAARPTDPASATAPRRWPRAVESALLAAGLFAVYLANGREIGSGDTVPAKYMTVALIRGDGFFLDRYRRPMLDEWPYAGQPYYYRSARGHLVSSYPVGPSVLAVPFTLPQLLVLDWTRPGWEVAEPWWFGTMAKRSAAAIAALTAVALLAVLRGLGLGRSAWPALVAAALGSNLWETASQSLWQHGPAALALTLILLLLLPESPSRVRFVLAGLAAALLVASRPVDLAFAATTALWVALRHPRRLAWFLPLPLALAAALLAYNRTYLGAAGGFYWQWNRSAFATPWYVGLSGTLLSPSRGLFVFSPWTIVAMAAAPFAFASLPRRSLAPWLIACLAAHALMVSTFTCWWAGHSFGPRFWTETVPLLAVAFAWALERARALGRAAYGAAALLVAASVAVQALGVAEYPSGWNIDPVEVARAPGRLWDWSDTELSRCFRAITAEPRPRPQPHPRTAAAVEAAPSATAEVEDRQRAAFAKATTVIGTLDRVDCARIQGWAWDPHTPDAPVSVDLYDGEALFATVTADRPRKDLARIGLGNGRHGFVFPTPDHLKDGIPHAIRARAAGRDNDLNNSPKPLSCPGPK